MTPNMETVKTGTYSPLSRPIFIYVSDAAIDRPEVVEFVKFYLNNAEVLVPDIGYIPLPSSEYQAQKQKFNSLLNDAD